MTARGRLLVFGGFFAIVILLIAVVGIIAASGPNHVQYSSTPMIEGERYVTDEFEPAFSFEAVGKGWTLDAPEAPRALLLHNYGLYLDVLNLNDVTVIDPSDADRVPAPEDMVGWYQQHPYLDAEKPEPVSIGGAKGVYFDAVMKTLPKGHPLVCEERLKGRVQLSLIGAPDGSALCLSPEDKVRIILLEDVKGEPVSIMMWSRAVNFEEHLAKAQKLLKTVVWEGT